MGEMIGYIHDEDSRTYGYMLDIYSTIDFVYSLYREMLSGYSVHITDNLENMTINIFDQNNEFISIGFNIKKCLDGNIMEFLCVLQLTLQSYIDNFISGGHTTESDDTGCVRKNISNILMNACFENKNYQYLNGYSIAFTDNGNRAIINIFFNDGVRMSTVVSSRYTGTLSDVAIGGRLKRTLRDIFKVYKETKGGYNNG